MAPKAAKLNKNKTPPVKEAALLFPEEQVGPYRFRPWSLDQFSALVDVLFDLILRLPAELSPEEFTAQSLKILPRLITPFLPRIIEVTLGISAVEVEEIPIGLRLALGLRILSNAENAAQIKNFMAGFMGSLPNPATPIH